MGSRQILAVSDTWVCVFNSFSNPSFEVLYFLMIFFFLTADPLYIYKYIYINSFIISFFY